MSKNKCLVLVSQVMGSSEKVTAATIHQRRENEKPIRVLVPDSEIVTHAGGKWIAGEIVAHTAGEAYALVELPVCSVGVVHRHRFNIAVQDISVPDERWANATTGESLYTPPDDEQAEKSIAVAKLKRDVAAYKHQSEEHFRKLTSERARSAEMAREIASLNNTIESQKRSICDIGHRSEHHRLDADAARENADCEGIALQALAEAAIAFAESIHPDTQDGRDDARDMLLRESTEKAQLNHSGNRGTTARAIDKLREVLSHDIPF